MKRIIKILQIKIQVNINHLIILYRDGEKLKEFDLDMKVQELKKEILALEETEKYILRDEDGKPIRHRIESLGYASQYNCGECESLDKIKFLEASSFEINKLRNKIMWLKEINKRYRSGSIEGLIQDIVYLIDEFDPYIYWPEVEKTEEEKSIDNKKCN